ncbi:hypothetical protein QBC34DRAFT_351713 [Podospora aff. communis PSN243]|uniref:ubiquitinyl hydrolase 1 n=1 Tax=Podospora aff. communis PSN243 TaxID=3040156 RepID=A0AAV9GMQ5_9PEZI|nr:hypothetical protein QBC34DRAFT_351713 [Podospora aff. communis PSN243]
MATGLPASGGKALDMPHLMFIIHHVFLPPQLPQADDTNNQHLLAMVQVLRNSVSAFLAAEPGAAPSVQPALDMIDRFLTASPAVNAGKTDMARRDALRNTITSLEDDTTLLHLRDQNAGLLLTCQRDNLLFETFELLAPNQNVMSCEGCLLREFPDRAVEVPIGKIRDPALLDVLVDAIQKLESTVLPRARPKVKKAGTAQPEERDTLSPVLATGLLTDVLAGLGREVHPERIVKRSREQVCWSDTRLPFHRSATWLLLRVGLRLVLDRRATLREASWYKPLMAYHCARLVDLALRPSRPLVSSDMIFCMESKLLRRIVKLDPTGDVRSGWLLGVHNTTQRVKDTLDARWRAAQKNDNRVLPLDQLSQLSFDQDSELKLNKLRKHLSWVDSRDNDMQTNMGDGDMTTFHQLPQKNLPCLDRSSHQDAAMTRCELLDFEAWVESSLSTWLNGDHPSPVNDVASLNELIEAYHIRASAAYDGIPGALSIMYLVILELWIAMDRLAGGDIPLLLDYDPGFPSNAFHSLLLERTEEMCRLHAVENYLARRRQEAPNSYPSAFKGFGDDNSFAVRFASPSVEHQRLRRAIEAWGAQRRAEKLEEYERSTKRYRSLAEDFDAASCEYYYNSRHYRHFHSSSCRRCRLEREMLNVNIDVFEWPLPAENSHADAAVFEISVPRAAVLWRNVTWMLVTRVFREKKEEGFRDAVDNLYFAADRQGMSRFRESKSDLHPASTVKPMEVAHYRTKHITEATPENVCVPHAAQYSYYDGPSRVRTERSNLDAWIPRHCSFAELVKDSPVEDWVRYAKHTSNDVIAGQHLCPLALSLREFRGLGNLRSGVNLQWANILCELVVPSLDFNRVQTFALILQACLEAGPQAESRSIWREAHVDTQKGSFMNQIMPALSEALLRIRESWQNNVGLCILTCLATRLLALSRSADISAALLDYLGQLRHVSMSWAKLLRDKLDKSCSTLDRERWIERLLLAALTCGATFNMGAAHLEQVLSDPNSLAWLVESNVLVRNHLPPSGRPAHIIGLQMMQRWHAVMYRARHLVATQVLERGNPGLDMAIKRLWADYSPSPDAGWAVLNQNAQQSHILTRTSDGQISVTFNLVTGGFFLNGFPLSKLPSSYQRHSTFQELLGEQILDVGPSRVPGMQFSASRELNGWVLHFAMVDSRLVVRAVGQDSQDSDNGKSYEYIPREYLSDGLPNSFVNDYAHWLHLATREVEFRPIDRVWDLETGGWCLRREDGSNILRKGSRIVVNPQSPTGQLCHEILASFEAAGDINLILDCNDSSLALELPRLSLSFQLHQGTTTILSKNYSGMQIDGIQGIGSLVGLLSKLVLKPEHGPGFRMVLVPRGQTCSNLAQTFSHVEVTILRRSNDKRIRHAAFYANDKLGCLTDSGSLQTKLFLCHLHALTSHCLPDPLTSRTGTEEALRILQSAAVRSYPTLDRESRALLGDIASLSPLRAFYPAHLQEMEQTAWSNALPPLSQHDDFWPLARDILDEYKKLEGVFQPRKPGDAATSSRDVLSVMRAVNPAERARIRNATFRVSEFGAERYTTDKDNWYHSRDRAGPSGGDSRVLQLVRRMDTGSERLVWKPGSDIASKIEAINGPRFGGDPAVHIGFDLKNTRAPGTALKGLWCGLHRALVAETNKFKKMFFLSSLLYAEGSSTPIVQALMALGSISVFAQPAMLPPPDADFNLDIRRATLHRELTRITNEGRNDDEKCPEYGWSKRQHESVRDFESRRDRELASNSQAAVRKFVDELQAQIKQSWSVRTPTGHNYRAYLLVEQIMGQVTDVVETARRSEAFHSYLNLLSSKLGRVGITHSSESLLASSPRLNRPSSKPGLVSATSIFMPPAPRLPTHHSSQPPAHTPPTMCNRVREPQDEHSRLSALLDELSSKVDLQEHEVSYIAELRRSLAAQPVAVVSNGTAGPLESLQTAQARFDSILKSVKVALAGTSIAQSMCFEAGIYPRISPLFLLRRLTQRFWPQLSRPWQKCLIGLALSMVLLQRAERLSVLSEHSGDRQRELTNPGDHENPDWDLLKYPENLLLEIEQGIAIRAVQNKIGAAMRSPPGMKNAVMQLNMGEGKSSVIVPIVAAALANGKRLVRIVVAKPQSNQMTHMLIGKLGGLLNRQVFYLPFSRSVQLCRDGVRTIGDMIERCRAEGGVLLVQPEHLLSFKLMGIDKSWAAEGETTNDGGELGESITRLYQTFESVSRDIVDVSDENFSVKYELIYTMGAQEAVEMSPGRWILVQQLLDLLETAIRRLMAESARTTLAEGIVFEDYGPGRVPLIRILGESAGHHLIGELAATICRRGLTGFPVLHQSERMRQAVHKYISASQVVPEDLALVEDVSTGLFSSRTAKDAVLLLRGLLANGVLLFALGQKRYRVNYGLAPARRPQTMLAVPYRAKDMPSPRSEFSHPDVVIVLTCLSYYYGGLSDEQLYTCFELLHDSDQAEQEYGRWAAKAPGLPPSFQHFSAINIEDKPQCENVVFPALRYARPVVDFFLAYVVFPKEMKQFPLKLSSSGWDLAKPKKHPLTGFSGTNDSKGVLPLSVKALDLQPHTNAAVLTTLLRDENTVLEVGTGKSRLSALSEEMLLGSLALSEAPMRVVLDVGAQIVESSNLQMARKMLGLVPVSSADAVIFFDDEDELSILLRDGNVVPFLTSPFATRTDRCLVFLDQAHTRGTDLKLPDNYRAAVTLGPGVTKDTLVQACMRMRKLGRGQSVTFIVSPEMQQRIRAVRNMAPNLPLGVADVISWAISETWDEMVRSVLLWAAQGIRHIRQEKIWKRVEEQGVFSPSDAQEYLEPEAMSLEERYRPKLLLMNGETEISAMMAALDIQAQTATGHTARQEDPQMSAIREKLRAFSHATRANTTSSTLQEEQERELAPEIEEERHVARPPPRKALLHLLSKQLVQFVRTGSTAAGSTAAGSTAFLPCFSVLSTTSASSLFGPGLSAFPGDLFATKDFAHTVNETGPAYRSDSYQRSVQWVLVRSAQTRDEIPNSSSPRMVLISQWEASRLKHVIEKLQQELNSKKAAASVPVTLHAYLPRPSLTFRSMEHLKTYTVPPLPADWEAPLDLVMQLNLFAGQLYLRSYDEYKRLCRYLGLSYEENRDKEAAIPPDGFVGKRKDSDCRFEESPVAFLAKVYHEIRGDCVGGAEKTHMGKILAGEILTEKDFPEAMQG